MTTLEHIASEVVLLNSEDHEARRRIERMLREMAQSPEVSSEVQETAWQAIVILQGLLQARDPEASLARLNELVEGMLSENTVSTAIAAPAKPLAADATTSEAGTIAADDSTLKEYLNCQETTLSEFEALCLRLEEGEVSALGELKRQLHTWKGEAGSLHLEDLPSAIHAIEEALTSASVVPVETIGAALLEFKDQLAAYFEARRNSSHMTLDAALILRKLSCSEALPEATTASSQTGARIFKIPVDVDLDLVQEFRTESAEHFLQAEQALMTLESDPSDAESVNTVFRAFHTVKGVSGFVGLSYITELAHKAENFFDRIRKGQLRMEGRYTDLAFEALDMLKGFLANLNDALAAGEFVAPDGFDTLIQRLEHPEGGGDASREPVDLPVKPAASSFEVFATSSALRSAANAEPSPASDVTPASVPERSPARAPESTPVTRSGTKEGEGENVLKVSTARLDNLINMVGELVIAQSMVSQDPDIQQGVNPRLTRNVGQLSKITRALQELALAMRMVSVKPTFQKMARLIRDLARKSQKEIQFVIEGEDTELDRNMVEAIADPLVHMVRNAADHGIEPPDERVRCGKPRPGQILLRAAHEGGSVVINLQDNGRGLNTRKILDKAIERGLIEPTAQLTDAEIYNLIFLPGFSTAEKVTDVSGRGVGMDVVRTNVEALRGTCEISSRPGEGSSFNVRLPLTLAIIDGMVIRVGCERFILPTIAITESFQPRTGDITTVQGQAELVLLRGDLLPVCRLHRQFGIRNAMEDLTLGTLVVIASKGRRLALLVDELLGQQQVVIKNLGSIFRRVPGVSGGAILGDGRVSLILDVEGLIKLSARAPAAARGTEVVR